MFKAYNASAFVTSMLVHIVLLFTFWLIRIGVIQADPEILVDSIFTEERIQQEFSQEIIETKLAENITNISGGKLATHVSSAASRALPTVKVEQSNALKDPEGRSRW